MKKTFLFGVMCFFAVAVSAQFVDLGLPSGTLWKDANEAGWHAFGDIADFEYDIPTKQQWEELMKECTWKCHGDAYQVTGPNGKSIFFSLEGYRKYDEEATIQDEGTMGYYCTSQNDGKNNVFCVHISSSSREMLSVDKRNGLSVRMVINKGKEQKTKDSTSSTK